jgi:tetratricopeptide (TPR) repeat protein
MRAETRFLVVVGVVLAAAASAHAADNAAAKAAFTEGERNFQLGKFDAAIDAYERAFGLDPQPAFLFNIALSHRRQYEIDGRIDHLARARELYRNYLKLEPHAPNRSGVEKLISELSARIDAARSGPPEPAQTPAPADSAAALPVAAAPPEQPAAVLSSAPAGAVEPPASSTRRWVIGGSVAAAAVVAALAIFFITRSGPSFDGPGVNVTDMH